MRKVIILVFSILLSNVFLVAADFPKAGDTVGSITGYIDFFYQTNSGHYYICIDTSRPIEIWDDGSVIVKKFTAEYKYLFFDVNTPKEITAQLMMAKAMDNKVKFRFGKNGNENYNSISYIVTPAK